MNDNYRLPEIVLRPLVETAFGEDNRSGNTAGKRSRSHHFCPKCQKRTR